MLVLTRHVLSRAQGAGEEQVLEVALCYMCRGMVLRRLGLLDEAYSDLVCTQHEAPHIWEATAELAHLALDRDDAKGAVALLKKAAPELESSMPEHSRGGLYCLLGDVYLRLARPAPFASRSLLRALLTQQVNPGSLYRRGRST